MRHLLLLTLLAGSLVFASSANAASISTLRSATPNSLQNLQALSIWLGGAGGHSGWSALPTATPRRTIVIPWQGMQITIPIRIRPIPVRPRPAPAVPEPTAALLFATGIAVVAARRKRSDSR